MDASLLDTEWIWHPEWIDDDQNSAGGLVHFRKQFDINTAPSNPLKIQITADTRYKLYVNSTLVHYGPVKGDENMWFYDEVDVQPFLRQGTNHIGIRVLRFYYATPHATSFPRLPIPGLFIRSADPYLRQVYGIQSDETWECALDSTTLLRIDQQEDDFLHIYEDADATRSSDLVWMPAKQLQLPKSHGLAPPWILSPRMIPVSTPSITNFRAIHNIRSPLPREDWESLLLSSSEYAKDLRLPSGSTHHIEIEAEHHLTAMLSFLFRRPSTSSSTLRITYSECYEDEPVQIPYIRNKGDRTDTTKKLYGPQDKYVFAGEAGAKVARSLAYGKETNALEIFSPFHFRTLRFISMDIDVAEDSDLVMKGIELSEIHYPLDVLGSFEVSQSDPLAKSYHTIWDISVRTLVNCMHDCYEDCPFYEQLQYAMDVRSSCLFTYAISGDDRMARQAIIQLHNSYQPALGLIASRSPAHQLQIIPHFSLFWICTVTDHFEHFADKTFTRQFLATCDGILETFDRRIDPILGLVASGAKELATTWDFTDWAPEWQPMGIPPQRTGYQTFTNLIYAYTLKSLAHVMEYIGRKALGDEYLSRASAIINAVQEHCWNGSLFTDGLASKADYSQDLSEQNQIWAVLSGAAHGNEASTLLSRSLMRFSNNKEGGLTKASMAMSMYTLRAMSKAGGTIYEDAFHAFWEPWRGQIANNLTTWCEDDVTVRSDCHAWSSVPLYEFMTEVAGITPAGSGWSDIAFKPRVNLFSTFDARVPLCGFLAPGVAHVTWGKHAEGSSVRIQVVVHNAPIMALKWVVTFPDGHLEEHVGPELSIEFKLE